MNVGAIINTIQKTNKIVRKGGFLYGDKIIYDSGNGYDIGIYIEPSKTVMFAKHLNLSTGIIPGEFHTTGRVIHFNEKNYNEICNRYGYKLT